MQLLVARLAFALVVSHHHAPTTAQHRERARTISMLASPRKPPPPANVDALRAAFLPQLLSGAVLTKVATAMPEPGAAPDLASSLQQLEELGLTRADIGAILAKRPTAIRRMLGDNGAELAAVIKELLDQGVNDAAALLLAQPKVLDFDRVRLAEAVRFLEGYVGNGRFGEFVCQHPEALLWRDENALPVAAHLQSLGVSKAVIEHVRRSFPNMDSLLSADNVASLLALLQDELGLSNAQLGGVIKSYPQLLGLSLEKNVLPKLEYVRSLGVAPSKAFGRHPALFGLSLNANIRPTVSYLEGLGVDVAKAVQISPSILSLSLEANLMPTEAYLKSLGMASLGRVLTQQPSILSLSVAANLEPKVAFLRALGLGDLPGGLGAQLDAYPALLTLSLEANLRPTAEALIGAGLVPAERPAAGGKPTSLRPRHLAASLDARVKPRLAFVSWVKAADAAGRLDGFVGKGEAKLTVGTVTTSSDADFAKVLGATAADYAAFKKTWLEQNRTPNEAAGRGRMAGLEWLPEGFDLASAVLASLPPEKRP